MNDPQFFLDFLWNFFQFSSQTVFSKLIELRNCLKHLVDLVTWPKMDINHIYVSFLTLRNPAYDLSYLHLPYLHEFWCTEFWDLFLKNPGYTSVLLQRRELNLNFAVPLKKYSNSLKFHSLSKSVCFFLIPTFLKLSLTAS